MKIRYWNVECWNFTICSSPTFLHFSSVIVQHPMRRLLSTYLTIFRNTDMHIHSGITNYLNLFWLKKRPEKLIPTKDEPNQMDTKDRPTLTFRQFVNFILYCPKEVNGCDVSFGLCLRFCIRFIFNVFSQTSNFLLWRNIKKLS